MPVGERPRRNARYRQQRGARDTLHARPQRASPLSTQSNSIKSALRVTRVSACHAIRSRRLRYRSRPTADSTAGCHAQARTVAALHSLADPRQVRPALRELERPTKNRRLSPAVSSHIRSPAHTITRTRSRRSDRPPARPPARTAPRPSARRHRRRCCRRTRSRDSCRP